MSSAIIRILDIVAAALVGACLLPLLMIAGLLVRLDSPGPALFRQWRVGRNETPFQCLKLRTMREGTPSLGSHEVSASQVTALGGRLRRLKIDELPQLWNVLVGEMSLVGPRPCLPVQRDVIEARRAHGVFDVRPGVTGPAQIKGIDMSMPIALADEDARWTQAPRLTDYLGIVLLTLAGRGRGDRVNGTR